MTQNTPLYSALIREAEKKTIRMHMPGHKGKAPVNFDPNEIFRIDFTELPGTGNLYEGIPPISDAEELMAKAASAANCFYITGGATQGVMTCISVACPLGSTLIVDRGSHRSVWNAMAHLDLTPDYIYADKLEPCGIGAPISPAQVEEAIKKNSGAKAVILTSPTFYGVIADIEAISEITKKYKVTLIVDEAHGAHLPFMNGYNSAVSQGANLSIASAHKTLPTFTAGAFIFSDGSFDFREIRRKTAIFGTSSPGYTVMASMDTARAYLEGEGGVIYNQMADLVKKLRHEITSRGVFMALEETEELTLDPTRLTINTGYGGINGYEAARIMEERYNIVPEMADERNVVMIITSSDTPEEMEIISKAIKDMEKTADHKASLCKETLAFPKPVSRLSPRDSTFAEKEYMILKDASGKISGEHLSPYPPGIPIVAAGEEIGQKQLEYLKSKFYDIDREIAVIKE